MIGEHVFDKAAEYIRFAMALRESGDVQSGSSTLF
jgi:hypothetical protein